MNFKLCAYTLLKCKNKNKLKIFKGVRDYTEPPKVTFPACRMR